MYVMVREVYMINIEPDIGKIEDRVLTNQKRYVRDYSLIFHRNLILNLKLFLEELWRN